MRLLVKRGIAAYLVAFIAVAAITAPLQSQAVEDPIARCHRIAGRAERICYLQFENSLTQIGGAGVLTCLAGFLGGSVPLAVIICLVALGISLLVAMNLAEQYNLCVEQAQEDLDVCIETNCT